MIFYIHTEETVHGVYVVDADTEEQARDMFDRGDVNQPSLYEAIDATVENITNENN